MDELQNRYDDLDNIESSLRVLIDEITDKYYIEQLQEIMYEAAGEKEDIEQILIKEQEKEMAEENMDFERSRLEWH